jgi:predicted GNAT family acetyltransferase
MAGERLQTPDYAEISAVCTDPAARGRGLAAALTRHVAAAMVNRGQTPLLHVEEHNDVARRVYERLGFRTRVRVPFVAVRAPNTGQPDGQPAARL